MCLEAFLAVNLLADLILLSSVSRALGLFNRKRVLPAALLCAVYGTVATAAPAPMASVPVQLAALCAVSMLVAGPSARGHGVLVALGLGASALCGGGLAGRLTISAPWAALSGAALGALPVFALLMGRPPSAAGCEVTVRLRIGGSMARFTALVDTGNRLREPVSGLPVLIAEAGLLKGRLPGAGYRTLRYGAVGGDGRMACFKPAAVWIARGARLRRVPDVWVALSPTPLPGLFRALAPSVFSLYI